MRAHASAQPIRFGTELGAFFPGEDGEGEGEEPPSSTAPPHPTPNPARTAIRKR